MRTFVLTLSLLLFFTAATGQESDRAELVQQLQKLKAAVLQEDKQAVLRFFRFPVKNKTLKAKIEGDESQSVNIKTLNQKQFLKHYNRLITPEVVDMFRQLDLTKLCDQDELIIEVLPKDKNDHCTRIYELVILNKEVGLSFQSNTRRDTELPEGAFCAEVAEFWQFVWGNGKLQFKAINVAG